MPGGLREDHFAASRTSAATTAPITVPATRCTATKVDLITVFIDIFRSPDLSGGAKALWFLFVLRIPLIGVVVYLIVRGGTMNERSVW